MRLSKFLFKSIVLLCILVVYSSLTSTQKTCNSPLLKDNSLVKYKASSSFSDNNEPSHIGQQNGRWCPYPWDDDRWIEIDLGSMYVLNKIVLKYRWPEIPEALPVKTFVISWSESGDIDKWNIIDPPFTIKSPLSNLYSELNTGLPISNLKNLRVNVTSPKNGMFCMSLQLYGCSANCSSTACPEGYQCTVTANGDEQCQQCKPGYVKKGNNCIAKAPCMTSPCGDHENSRCISHVPFEYACVCKQNFTGDGKTCTKCSQGYIDQGSGCIDINECSMDSHICKENELCVNTDGSYHCQCKLGFTKDKYENCQDVDECLEDQQAACPSDKTKCVNKDGSFECQCKKSGYIWLDDDCVDINECKSGQHSCKNAICENTEGGYKCRCKTGYKFNKNDMVKRECIDVDECMEDKFLRLCVAMDAVCKNTIGSYKCACESGYVMSNELKKCVDHDECKDDSPCSNHAICRNLKGTYRCTCKPGYAGDGRICVQDLAMQQQERDEKIALIAGSGGGGLLAIMVVIAIALLCRKKKKNKDTQEPLLFTAFDPGFDVGYVDGEPWQEYEESDYESYDEFDNSNIGDVFESSHGEQARDDIHH